MDKKKQMLESRKRLDKTLASSALASEESIKNIVKNQLLRSSPSSDIEGDVLQRRSMEVSNFLEMLRSASSNDCEGLKTPGTSRKDWKLKQDDDQIRVMYREGPEGTPFHTLLAEGYVDGPIDVCLCVSWESTLYRKWWPQFNIPPFKITMSTCLQKVQIGEEISLVRVKVPWPVSAREVVLHYFELEYFEDDLIIVLLNTVPDTEDIDVRKHGFSSDGIPEAKDMVRVGLVGGFALQRMSPNKSYFRTIANLDIKLDFVPPALINFVARQLIGRGFKLYQKAVASVANGEQDFSKALKERPMYIRIREGLKYYDENKDPKPPSNTRSAGLVSEEQSVKMVQAHIPDIDHTLHSKINEDNICLDIQLKETTNLQVQDGLKSYVSQEGQEDKGKTTTSVNEEHRQIAATDHACTSEIMEDKTDTTFESEGSQHLHNSSSDLVYGKCHVSQGSSFISPEVEQALGILDKAIAFVRRHAEDKESLPHNQKLLNSGIVAKPGLASSHDGGSALPINYTDKLSEDANDNLIINDVRRACDADVNQKALEMTMGEQNITIPEKTQEGFVSSVSCNGVIDAKIEEAPVGKHNVTMFRKEGVVSSASSNEVIHAKIEESPVSQSMIIGVVPPIEENGECLNGSIFRHGKGKTKQTKWHQLCCW